MKFSLNQKIFIGAALGISFGLLLGHCGLSPQVTKSPLFVLELIGRIFINLLKMILVPLVFTSIAAGIGNLQRTTQGHRVWPALLAFFLTTTTLATLTGLIAVNVFKPGVGMNIQLFEKSVNPAIHPVGGNEFIRALVNGALANPIAAMAENNILAIVVFAIFLGIALVVLGEKAAGVSKILNELFDITMLIVGWVMRVAPFGIMGLLANLVAHQDVRLLSTLGSYIALVIGTTLFHGLVTLPLILWMLTRISPLKFFFAMREAFLVAFSTSSSSATLPFGLRGVTQNLGVDKNVAGFVLPVGATINMDGTALYEAMAALFVANLCGVQLDLAHQIIVMLTAMLASIGAPGIPSAGMVTMIMVLQSVGLPIEAVAMLIAIDRPLDTVRTVVNVEGDYIGACVVQKIVDGNYSK